MIFTLAYLEHELLTYAILFVNHVLIAINLRKFLTMTAMKKEADLREKMLDGLRVDLSAQIESVRAMKLWRHDLRHHLQTLMLAHQGYPDEFEAQVEKLKGKLDETTVVTYCHNFSINAVLSSYFKQAHTENIAITHRIELPESLPIQDIDLSLILANAIENAIHANQKLKEADRHLQVTINHDPSRLTILIENPLHETITFKDGLPVSSQIDHGLGTLSISRLAQQAQGQAYFNAQKGRFTLIVQLPL
jgi:sensor histidine kinase regulating citrate/malate metabolism